MKPMMFALVMVLSMVTGCRESPPDAYVAITGKIFIFNYRVATANYVVTLAKVRAIPDGSVVQTRFDDPAGGAPILVEQKVWPRLDKIAIESPPVFCIVKEKPYAFEIEIKTIDGTVLQKLSGTVVSSLDQTVMPDRPLVVGPAYTPNPDLAGRPDGKLPGGPYVKCGL